MAEMTILVKLLKGCAYGREGDVVRLSNREGLKACERGLARVHEWRPATRRPRPDVLKGGHLGGA